MTTRIDYYITMVSKNTELVNIKGSSLTLPAHGRGGARARKNAILAKKFACPSEDGSAGGFKGGMPSRPSVKIEASPAACSFRAEPSKILFSLIGKIFRWRAQIPKCKEYFAWRRALASGGGAERVIFAQNSFAQSLEYPTELNQSSLIIKPTCVK